MKTILVSLLALLVVGCATAVATHVPMIEDVVVTIMTHCGQPQLAFAWGGEVQPFVSPVAPAEGGFLAPNQHKEEFQYLLSHPDLSLQFIETVDPSIKDLVCQVRRGS